MLVQYRKEAVEFLERKYNPLVQKLFRDLQKERTKDPSNLATLLDNEWVKLKLPLNLDVYSEDGEKTSLMVKVDVPLHLTSDKSEESQGYIETGVSKLNILVPLKYQEIQNKKLKERGFSGGLGFSNDIVSLEGVRVFLHEHDHYSFVRRVEGWFGKYKLVKEPEKVLVSSGC